METSRRHTIGKVLVCPSSPRYPSRKAISDIDTERPAASIFRPIGCKVLLCWAITKSTENGCQNALGASVSRTPLFPLHCFDCCCCYSTLSATCPCVRSRLQVGAIRGEPVAPLLLATGDPTQPSNHPCPFHFPSRADISRRGRGRFA